MKVEKMKESLLMTMMNKRTDTLEVTVIYLWDH
jgi:hypothetical protein